jgi:hypothetical protein
MNAIIDAYGQMANENHDRLGEDQFQAQALAMMIRNAVEDLHADGAFGDDLMPAFNRTVRSWLYTIRLIEQLPTDADLPRKVFKFLRGLRSDHSVGGAGIIPPLYVIATDCSVRAFCAENNIPTATCDALAGAANDGLLPFFEALHNDDEETAMRELVFAGAMIPSYWEPAEVLPALGRVLV